jgi:hypothetical protein
VQLAWPGLHRGVGRKAQAAWLCRSHTKLHEVVALRDALPLPLTYLSRVMGGQRVLSRFPRRLSEQTFGPAARNLGRQGQTGHCVRMRSFMPHPLHARLKSVNLRPRSWKEGSGKEAESSRDQKGLRTRSASFTFRFRRGGPRRARKIHLPGSGCLCGWVVRAYSGLEAGPSSVLWSRLLVPIRLVP